MSQRHDDFPKVLQHDRSWPPPIAASPVDLNERVLGINIARAARTETYAVPSEVLLALMYDLMSGRLPPPREPAKPEPPKQPAPEKKPEPPKPETPKQSTPDKKPEPAKPKTPNPEPAKPEPAKTGSFQAAHNAKETWATEEVE